MCQYILGIKVNNLPSVRHEHLSNVFPNGWIGLNRPISPHDLTSRDFFCLRLFRTDFSQIKYLPMVNRRFVYNKAEVNTYSSALEMLEILIVTPEFYILLTFSLMGTFHGRVSIN